MEDPIFETANELKRLCCRIAQSVMVLELLHNIHRQSEEQVALESIADCFFAGDVKVAQDWQTRVTGNWPHGLIDAAIELRDGLGPDDD